MSNYSPLNQWLKDLLVRPAANGNYNHYRDIVYCLDYNVTQFLTGHGNFGSYLFRFKIRKDNNYCPFGIEDQYPDCLFAEDSVFHTLFICKRNTDCIERLNRIGIFGRNLRTFFNILISKDERAIKKLSEICNLIIQRKIEQYYIVDSTERESMDIINDEYPP